MLAIESITASPRKEGRYQLTLSDRSTWLVSVEIVDRLKLRVGTEIDEPRRELLTQAVAQLATFDRALNMLAFRARASRELERALVRKGEDRANVAWAIDRLTTLGLLDDERYARDVTRSKVLGAGMSRRRVGQELGKRGVARAVADEAIAGVMEEEAVDESAVALTAARKRVRALASLDADTRRRRLFAWLVRRGYDLDHVKAAVDAVLREDTAETTR